MPRRVVKGGDAFPLHRTTLTLGQRWGDPVRMLLAAVLEIIGLLFLLGSRSRGGASGLAIWAACTVAAIGVFVVGGRLSRLRPADGLVVVHEHQIDIIDERLLRRPLVVQRESVLRIVSPGIREPGATEHWRATAEVRAVVRGGGRPNVEIWLPGPLVVQLQTPAASTLLSWLDPSALRFGVDERWYEDPGEFF
jgi:hypothetical protein